MPVGTEGKKRADKRNQGLGQVSLSGKSRSGEWEDGWRNERRCPWEAQKEGPGDLLKTDSVCFTAPVLLIPPHRFLHFSAWGLKGRSTEIISQGLALSRSVNWAETPKPQSLYLHNGNKKETVS